MRLRNQSDHSYGIVYLFTNRGVWPLLAFSYIYPQPRYNQHATRIDFSINFCLKQPKKMLAFFYGNFENSKSRGSMHKSCRRCRPHQTSGVVGVNAQTCVESIAFKNGPKTCFSRFCRSNARSRADLEVVCTKKFPINVVNNLG